MARFGGSISVFLDRETRERCSVLDQYDAALNLYRKYYQYEKVEGASRNTYELVPEAAYRGDDDSELTCTCDGPVSGDGQTAVLEREPGGVKRAPVTAVC